MRKLFIVLALSVLPITVESADVIINGNTYTLTDHPRLLMDGPSGTITLRVKDPDGTGAGVSPQADDANPAFQALKDKIRACRATPTFCSSADERATVILLGALDWFMDNSQTDSLAMAMHWINNIETWLGHSTFQFACDPLHVYCGKNNNWNDWPSGDIVPIMQAYSIIRSEMSGAERTAFAQKMFNNDVLGYEDGCTNQLQQEVGATASFTTGTTAITGTNLGGLTAGRVIYIKVQAYATGQPGGAWATIATVNSPTSITTVSPPVNGGFQANASITNGLIYERKPWTSTTCGFHWVMMHDQFAPKNIPLGYFQDYTTTNYTPSSTSITMHTVTGLPATTPYYMRESGGEIIKVTNRVGNVLTIERGAFGTTARTGSAYNNFQYTRYIPNIGYGDTVDNNVLLKVYGAAFMGIGLADDIANAASEAGVHLTYWLNSVYAKERDMWTGFNQGGGSNYGPGRQLSQNLHIVGLLKNIPSGSSPSLDKSGGIWLHNLTEQWLYTTLPNSPSRFVPWGQPDVLGLNVDYRTHEWMPIITYLYGASADDSKYWNFWQRTVTSNHTRTGLNNGADERMIPFSLLFWQQSDPSVDYRTVYPTEKAFNQVDGNPAGAISHWVSRTGFSSTSDTLIFMQSKSYLYTQDHMGATGGPGAYKIFKKGWQLTENSAYDTGMGSGTNMLRFGADNLKGCCTGLRSDMDKSAADTGWSFVHVNAVGAYTSTAAATRALRSLIHFKKAASPDYIVVYDTMATTVASILNQVMYYDKTSGQVSSVSVSMPDMVWTGPDRRISTKVILPSGVNVRANYVSLTDSHQIKLSTSTDGTTEAPATSTEFLIVHKPGDSITDTMPTVAALGTIDSDFVGVQISDPTAPSIAVFAKNGVNQVTGSFTTTHSGTAQYVITGLTAGAYDVTRGVTSVLDNYVVDTNGALSFESVSGAFTIQEGTAPPPECDIADTSLPNAVVGVAYQYQLSQSGCTGAVTYTKTSSACAGVTVTSGGLIQWTAGAPATCTETYTITDSLSQTGNAELSITAVAPPSSCVITTTSLPNGVRNVEYSASMASSECTAPLTWTTTPSDFCPGLLLNSTTGVFSNPPSTVGTCNFTVNLTDSGTGSDSKTYNLVIDPPPAPVLNITTLSPLSICVQNQPCSTTFDATGGVPPYIWSRDSGTYCVGNSNLVAGTGVLSGLPTVLETCTFVMKITDSASPTPATDTKEFQRTIVNPSPSMTVSAIPGSIGAVLRFGTPQLDQAQQCDAIVDDVEIDPISGLPYGPVASGISLSGYSTRLLSISGLLPLHRHNASVVCGTAASGSTEFTTVAIVGGTINYKLTAKPNSLLVSRGAEKISWYATRLDTTGDINSLHNACSPGPCTVSLSLTSGGNYSIVYAWETSGDSEIVRSTRPQVISVP